MMVHGRGPGNWEIILDGRAVGRFETQDQAERWAKLFRGKRVSGFICDSCKKEMLIAEAHHELDGSDFPICDECFLEAAIRKGGARHE